MTNLLKYTYILNVVGIKREIERLWSRYQSILDNGTASWEELNEARAILYLLGYLYPEKIALESIKTRVLILNPPIDLDEFLRAIDIGDEKVLNLYVGNRQFEKIREFYLAVKGIKNRVKNGSYLDEDRFNEIYGKTKPSDYF